ncbi:hypothetical protein C8R44DRAFT_806815 [Mycena epipterygia]|nr:hypothetical protein C8R44DRAFT_806815 [Mycena epipterygia]
MRPSKRLLSSRCVPSASPNPHNLYTNSPSNQRPRLRLMSPSPGARSPLCPRRCTRTASENGRRGSSRDGCGRRRSRSTARSSKTLSNNGNTPSSNNGDPPSSSSRSSMRSNSSAPSSSSAPLSNGTSSTSNTSSSSTSSSSSTPRDTTSLLPHTTRNITPTPPSPPIPTTSPSTSRYAPPHPYPRSRARARPPRGRVHGGRARRDGGVDECGGVGGRVWCQSAQYYHQYQQELSPYQAALLSPGWGSWGCVGFPRYRDASGFLARVHGSRIAAGAGPVDSDVARDVHFNAHSSARARPVRHSSHGYGSPSSFLRHPSSPPSSVSSSPPFVLDLRFSVAALTSSPFPSHLRPHPNSPAVFLLLFLLSCTPSSSS